MGRVVLRFLPHEGLRLSWRLDLPTCDHPTEWVQIAAIDMTNFKGKGNPAPEYGPGICQHLHNDYDIGQEGVVVES